MSLKQFAINYSDNGSYRQNTMKLYSCVNNLELVNLLKNKIESFGVNDVTIHESKSSTSKRKYWYISIGTKGSYKLSSLIAKYIHPCLSYKIHSDFHKEIGTYKWEKKIEREVGATVISAIENNYEKQNVYDLEIENNHNFIVCSKSGSKKDISKSSGIIVHNCQDLNKAQRELLIKCKKINTRIVSAGDNSQCVYSFSGSDPESFKRLKELPNTTALPLSISYRCAKNIVDFAKKIVPTIEENNDGRNGEVKYDVGLDEIQDGDMVLCRNNAPLMQVYIDFIKQGKKCFIRGKDIGLNLKNMVKRTGINVLNKNLQEDGVFVRLYDNLFDMINEIVNKYNVTYSDAIESAIISNKLDMIKALEIISDDINTSDELIEKINNIFSDRKKGGISLSTIHKAKGLEADNVYIACKSLMPSSKAKKDWEIRQEYNLMYVAYTRAKNILGFIDEKEFEAFNEKTSETVNSLKKIENQINYVLKKDKRKFEINNVFIANDVIKHATKIDKPKTEYKLMPMMINKEKSGIGFNDIFKRRLIKK